jgi:hypothetical protein
MLGELIAELKGKSVGPPVLDFLMPRSNYFSIAAISGVVLCAPLPLQLICGSYLKKCFD